MPVSISKSQSLLNVNYLAVFTASSSYNSHSLLNIQSKFSDVKNLLKRAVPNVVSEMIIFFMTSTKESSDERWK